MNEKHQRHNGKLAKVIPAILLSLYMPLSAQAGEIIALKSETPRIDTGSVAQTQPTNATHANVGMKTATQPPSVTKSAADTQPDSGAAESKPLQGQVSQEDNRLVRIDKDQAPLQGTADQDQTALQGAADKDQISLQSQNASPDNNQIYKLTVDKLRSGVQLTADDYRNLGIGTLGFESHRTFFQDKAEIEMIYKGGPAEAAGLHLGDVILDTNHDDSKVDDPTVPKWGINLAKAGTVSEIKLLRHGHITTISLTRMNIEDLPDVKVRRMWEKIINDLGHPPDGEYIIPDPDDDK